MIFVIYMAEDLGKLVEEIRLFATLTPPPLPPQKKTRQRDLIAATGLVILLKLD